MDKRELARQLVIGQQNLDRMKQDIHATINLILGLVGKTNDLFLNEKRQLVFESSHCKWTIQATSSKLPTGVGVICDRRPGPWNVLVEIVSPAAGFTLARWYLPNLAIVKD